MQINEAYQKADQKEMSIHVATLRACPAAKVQPPQVKKVRPLPDPLPRGR